MAKTKDQKEGAWEAMTNRISELEGALQASKTQTQTVNSKLQSLRTEASGTLESVRSLYMNLDAMGRETQSRTTALALAQLQAIAREAREQIEKAIRASY